MAHELSTVNNRVEMMYNSDNGKPWHKLGTSVEGLATTKQVLETAHLDWKVQKEPLYINNSGSYTAASGIHAITREDNRTILGYVGDVYKPLQNIDAFNFFDTLVGEGEAIYESAGAMFGGKRIWILARMPDYIKINDKDIVDKYILLYNGHDGKTSVIAKVTPVRVVCNNTLQLAMKSEGAKISIRHSGDMCEKVSVAHATLGLVNKVYSQVSTIFNQMANVSMTSNDTKDYFNIVFPKIFDKKGTQLNAEVRDNAITACIKLTKHGKGVDIAGDTLWRDYNAVVEFVDFYKEFRYDGTRMNNILFDSKLKHNAFKEAMALL